MAAHNAAPFLSEAILSVVDQELADFVRCIVDDGSEDGTGDVARRLTADDHRFMVVKQAHGGVSSARNLGVSELPPTDFLSFPDADDVWHTDALRMLVEAARDLGGAGAHSSATRSTPRKGSIGLAHSWSLGGTALSRNISESVQ